MKVIKPITIAGAVLVSSNATEAYSAWLVGTTYALDAVVLRTTTNRLYRCVMGPSTGNVPETSPLYWINIGPTNKWSMFDTLLSTSTVNTSDLTVVLDPGQIDSLALIGLVCGSISVTATDGPGGPVIYSWAVLGDSTIIIDWWAYFFSPFTGGGSGFGTGDLVLTDLPMYAAMRLTVTLIGASVSIANLSCGLLYDLGFTEYGVNTSIVDYSRKDTDAFGVTTFVRRGFSKRMSARSMVPTSRLSTVQRILADVRAMPCVWIGTPDTTTYLPLLIFGFYRDFSIEVTYSGYCYCSLEIEGLT